jgi:hypothetical protein
MSLKEEYKFLKPKIFCLTRWNTMYIMLERLEKLRNPILIAYEKYNSIYPENLNKSDLWDNINILKNFLEPYYNITL